MSLNSIIYEITLSHNGNEHVVDCLCLEPNELSLIKAIKSAISSLKKLGFNGKIKYCNFKERSMLPEFSYKNLKF